MQALEENKLSLNYLGGGKWVLKITRTSTRKPVIQVMRMTLEARS